jgi:hypothetical protein
MDNLNEPIYLGFIIAKQSFVIHLFARHHLLAKYDRSKGHLTQTITQYLCLSKSNPCCLYSLSIPAFKLNWCLYLIRGLFNMIFFGFVFLEIKPLHLTKVGKIFVVNLGKLEPQKLRLLNSCCPFVWTNT